MQLVEKGSQIVSPATLTSKSSSLLQGRTVLIVHDDFDTAAKLVRLIESYGGLASIATSKQQAEEAIGPTDRSRLDLAIVDNDLPVTTAASIFVQSSEARMERLRQNDSLTPQQWEEYREANEGIYRLVDPMAGYNLVGKWLDSGARFATVLMMTYDATHADPSIVLDLLRARGTRISYFFKPSTNERILYAINEALSPQVTQ